MLQHGDVEQVLQARLIVAVEVGVFQHVIGFRAPDVGMVGEKYPVLGQRPGLVGAQHIHRAEVLDGVQALDDDLASGQDYRALGQRRRDDHRQHFRRQADRDRHGEEKGFQPVALGEAVDEQDQRRHHQHETDQQPGHLVDPGLELRGDPVGAGDARRQGAEISSAAGGDDDRGSGAGDDIGAHEQNVVELERVADIAIPLHGILLDGQRFAGHRRLRDEQVLGGEHPAVGRYHVAGREQDHVAGHQQPERHLHLARSLGMQLNLKIGARFGHRILRRIAADDGGGIGDQGLQLFGGAIGFAFLPEAYAYREHHHAADDQGRLVVLGDIGYRRQGGQQDIEGGFVAVPEMLPPHGRLLMFDLIQADPLADLFGLRFRASVGVGIQPLDQELRGAGGRRRQFQGQFMRNFPADCAARKALEQGQTAEVPAYAAAFDEARKKIFQDIACHLLGLRTTDGLGETAIVDFIRCIARRRCKDEAAGYCRS